MLNPKVESIGFQREPAILRVAGPHWNLGYPLQIHLLKKNNELNKV
jgi:hypothetical protein